MAAFGVNMVRAQLMPQLCHSRQFAGNLSCPDGPCMAAHGVHDEDDGWGHSCGKVTYLLHASED